MLLRDALSPGVPRRSSGSGASGPRRPAACPGPGPCVSCSHTLPADGGREPDDDLPSPHARAPGSGDADARERPRPAVSTLLSRRGSSGRDGVRWGCACLRLLCVPAVPRDPAPCPVAWSSFSLSATSLTLVRAQDPHPRPARARPSAPHPSCCLLSTGVPRLRAFAHAHLLDQSLTSRGTDAPCLSSRECLFNACSAWASQVLRKQR